MLPEDVSGLIWLNARFAPIEAEEWERTGETVVSFGRQWAQWRRWPVSGYVGTMFARGHRIDLALG